MLKCPFCKKITLVESKQEGYLFCKSCGAIVYDKIKDDPELKDYKYKIEIMRSRKPEISDIFGKAIDKFQNSKYEVIATVMNRQEPYSLLRGQEFFVVKRKKK